jgi:hypothetical protein
MNGPQNPARQIAETVIAELDDFQQHFRPQGGALTYHSQQQLVHEPFVGYFKVAPADTQLLKRVTGTEQVALAKAFGEYLAAYYSLAFKEALQEFNNKTRGALGELADASITHGANWFGTPFVIPRNAANGSEGRAAGLLNRQATAQATARSANAVRYRRFIETRSRLTLKSPTAAPAPRTPAANPASANRRAERFVWSALVELSRWRGRHGERLDSRPTFGQESPRAASLLHDGALDSSLVKVTSLNLVRLYEWGISGLVAGQS